MSFQGSEMPLDSELESSKLQPTTSNNCKKINFSKSKENDHRQVLGEECSGSTLGRCSKRTESVAGHRAPRKAHGERVRTSQKNQ